MSAIRPFAFAAICIVLWCVSASASPVAWQSWNEGFGRTTKGGKPVLVDVYTDWCGWCKRMDRDVYARADVSQYLNDNFVSIKLNAESNQTAMLDGKSLSARALAAKFGVSGYPTTIFMRGDGEHLVNVPGYLPADRFLLLLRYIGEGHMDKGVAWEEFSKRAATAR